MYRTEEGHNPHAHHIYNHSRVGIAEETKMEVEHLVGEGTSKPKAILQVLKKKQLPIPTLQQLKNYLYQYRKKIKGRARAALVIQ